ncbi:endonuclease/exonuclease/phosphatase family protein [Cellulomonas sp. Marseille-Q8402]
MVVVLALLVVLVAPDRVGLAARTPFAQLVALRGLVAVLLVGAAALLLGSVGGFNQIARRAGLTPRRWALPLTVAGLLVGGAGAQGVVLAGRGLDGSGPGRADDADLVVLSFNTFGVVGPDALTGLVLAQDADVTVLAETSAGTASAVADALTAAGRPTTALAADAAGTRVDGVALLLRDSLGPYTQDDGGLPATELGTFAALPDDAGAPGPLVAAHTRAPSAETSMPDWRAHAAGIAAVCRSTPGVVVAGDLNATLDHPGLDDLGPCVDAAAEAGAAGLGTWPADVPRVLAAPIDHVLVDARVWRVTGFAALPAVGASDHRPVVAHLTRR